MRTEVTTTSSRARINRKRRRRLHRITSIITPPERTAFQSPIAANANHDPTRPQTKTISASETPRPKIRILYGTRASRLELPPVDQLTRLNSCRRQMQKTAINGEDTRIEITFDVRDRRNSVNSRFPPILLQSGQQITEEFFFSTFPAPFNSPPEREQKSDNGEILQTARNLAPKSLQCEEYLKFVKLFKVSIHAIRMEYELKINCLRACFPNEEFLGDGSSMLDYRKMIVRMNLRYGTLRRISLTYTNKLREVQSLNLRNHEQCSILYKILQAFKTALSTIGESDAFYDDSKYMAVVETLSSDAYHDFQTFTEARDLSPNMSSLHEYIQKLEISTRKYCENRIGSDKKATKLLAQATPELPEEFDDQDFFSDDDDAALTEAVKPFRCKTQAVSQTPLLSNSMRRTPFTPSVRNFRKNGHSR